jgi:hypothetical protein
MSRKKQDTAANKHYTAADKQKELSASFTPAPQGAITGIA